MFNISYKKMFLFMFFISLFSFLPNINIEDADIMEARNFTTAREILSENNWLIPTMNGEIRITKPPLPTWITTLGFLGNHKENLGLLRIPTVFTTIFMIFLFFYFVLTLTQNKDLSFISSIVLATSFLIFKMGRTASWDIYTNVFIVGCLFYLLKSIEHIKYSFIAGIFLGFSIMSKGPVSLYAVFLPFIISYTIIYNINFKKINYKKIIIFIITSLIIGGSWYFYIFFLHTDITLKVAQVESTAWLTKHTQPFWYYFHFPIFSGIWFVLGIGALFKKNMEKFVVDIKTYRFSLLWMLISFVLLSILPEKKERYLIPVVIPMALLIGQFIYSAFLNINKNSKFINNILKIHSTIIIIFSIYIPILLFTKNYYNLNIFYIIFLTICYIIFIILFLKNFKQLDIKKLFIYTLVFMLFSNIFFAPFYLKNIMFKHNRKYQALRDVKKTDYLDNIKIYSFHQPGIRNVWNIGHKIKMINKSELDNLKFPLCIIYYDYEKDEVENLLSSYIILDKKTFYFSNTSNTELNLVKIIKK